MLKISEIFEFSKEKFRKIPILEEFEWFEWFDPSPIVPFNSGRADLVWPRDLPLRDAFPDAWSSLAPGFAAALKETDADERLLHRFGSHIRSELKNELSNGYIFSVSETSGGISTKY